MKKNIFIDFALKVLTETKKPMTPQEIWDYGVQKGFDKELNSSGKTPWASLGAQLYSSEKSKKYFDVVGARPKYFVLKKYSNEAATEQLLEEQPVDEKEHLLEKELHPVLVSYLKNFWNVNAKTVNHLKSTRSKTGEWMHPDIVGAHFVFEEFDKDVVDLYNNTAKACVKFYSFELKRKLDFSNIRESFFQAVSNSSWANEGYLASSNILEDVEFKAELRRLSSLHGIGIIEIDPKNPNNCSVLYPAQVKEDLDWLTINKLTAELKNKDFKDFIIGVQDCIERKKVFSSCFDKVIDFE